MFLSYFAVAFIFLTCVCADLADLVESNLARDIEWKNTIQQDPELIAEANARGADAVH